MRYSGSREQRRIKSLRAACAYEGDCEDPHREPVGEKLRQEAADEALLHVPNTNQSDDVRLRADFRRPDDMAGQAAERPLTEWASCRPQAPVDIQLQA